MTHGPNKRYPFAQPACDVVRVSVNYYPSHSMASVEASVMEVDIGPAAGYPIHRYLSGSGCGLN